MESQTISWSFPSLTRQKPAIIAVAAVAVGCALYYIRDQITSSNETSFPAPNTLHRSNARLHRRRGRNENPPQTPPEFQYATSRYIVDQPWGSTPIDLGFLRTETANDEVLAQHVLRFNDGHTYRVPLTRHLPSVNDILVYSNGFEEASSLRRELEEAFLTLYLFRHLSPTAANPEQIEVIVHELHADGDFAQDAIIAVLFDHQSTQIRERIERWQQDQMSRIQEARLAGNSLPDLRPQNNQAISEERLMEILDAPPTVTDNNSEHSWREEGQTHGSDEQTPEGQSLLHLLYRIAEDNARKDGYVHRRVTCNACHTMPIRGVRYRCSNCLDYDLCEQCEAMQIHPKHHVFYKIRIPAPFLSHSKQPELSWYSERPMATVHSLHKDLTASICKSTGFSTAEVEALWEQYLCLAASELPSNSGDWQPAIDRQTFDRCLVPQTSLRPPFPNLIYDRMFSFYDQNGDGLISFREFVNGMASLTQTKADERRQRLFRGYDINNDGFVDRKDFLRIFRAYYALTKELTRDVIAGMEDDIPEDGGRSVVLGSQPLSSAFTGTASDGVSMRRGEGKSRDGHGDLRIVDDMSVVDHNEDDSADLYDTIANCMESRSLAHSQLNAIHEIIFAPWPPEAIDRFDVQSALGQQIPVEQVNDLEKQKQIRRRAHARRAQIQLEHVKSRIEKVRDREKRKAFYLDCEDGLIVTGALQGAQHKDSRVAEGFSRRKRVVGRLVTAGLADEITSFIEQKISELDWPLLDWSESLARSIRYMLLTDWSPGDMSEGLAGYASGFPNSKMFVGAVWKHLGSLVARLDHEEHNRDFNEKDQVENRSRSSSKVRFQDIPEAEDDQDQEPRSRATSISSRSIPMYERWGGLGVPEPEGDVGREVLYQVTQEALNELLDPIFKMREDLALNILETRPIREKYRAEAASAVEDPIRLYQDLDLYQKRWRGESIMEPINAWGVPKVRDECKHLREFLAYRKAGKMNYSTAEKVSHCNEQQSWIALGDRCGCGKSSSFHAPIRTTLGDKATPEETCPRCAQAHEHSIIGGAPYAIRCKKCDQESNFYKCEKDRLLAIISSGNPSSKPRETNSSGRYETILEHPDQQQMPFLPPEIISDLNDVVEVIEEEDTLSSDQRPSQRPLNDLLAESGYTIATTPRATSPPPDPTLPQNRPDNDQIPREPTVAFVEESQTPDDDTLRWYAALSLIEYDDKLRGGPGRLNFEEFEDVMKGEKGKSLGFLGTWMDMASF